MAIIEATRISVHFPLTGASILSGPKGPENLVYVGKQPYIHALRDLTFRISEGSCVGLIGRNGSGKSTLLRVLGKIYAPTSGHLHTVGQISSLFNLNLGMQPDATGRENIIIRGLIKGWSRREIRRRAPEIIEFSELADFIDLPVRTYSDGMRMRLLFAIATAFSPEILLLDEWIAAGDAKFKKKASARMNSLVSQAGITVIAGHNRNLLQSVCNLGMWLDRGILRAFGPINEVYQEMDAYFAETDNSVATISDHKMGSKAVAT